MKCTKCGKEIANDSNFCEYCGTEIKESNKKIWFVLTTSSLCSIAFAAFVVYTLLSQIEDNYLMTDSQQMNLRGSVHKITEKSYYTIDDMKDQRYEDGSFFDGCAFLSIVYGGEHLARLNYRNFFLQQVSDCKMFFNKDGNLEELTSLNPNGGSVRFHYEDGNALYSYNGIPLLKKMDVMERQDEEEVTDFQYEYEGDNLVREIQIGSDTWGDTINYIYKSNRLVRAESNYYVDYLQNGRIGTIHYPKFDHAQDLNISIEYNSNNDIVSVDWDKGTYGKVHTTFTYEYDSNNNWIERYATGTIESDSKTKPFSIRTVREYEYY